MTKPRIGVVLFQLGGPDSPQAVERFLYNLFCDPDIINFTGAALARRPLAWWIAHRRAAVVREHYDAIGGHSPIRRLTELQARELEQALAPDFDVRCSIAMRYWNPLTREALDAGAFRASRRSARRARPAPSVSALLLRHHAEQPQGMAPRQVARRARPRPSRARSSSRGSTSIRNISRPWCAISKPPSRRFDDRRSVQLVFSAHGLPLSLIERGDPYQRQVQETVAAVMARGGWPNAHLLCFQSRVGRQKWLEPSLTQTLERLPREGKKHLLVIPISFVTEHIETLHEINIEAREHALASGVEQFEMMPALDDSPDFIAALASLVRAAVAEQGAAPASPAKVPRSRQAHPGSLMRGRS